MKFVPSPLKLNLLKITLIPNSNPRFLHLIKSFEKNKETIDFKGKQQMEPSKFSSEHIENEVLILSSKNHPLKIDLRPNSNPSLINLIKFLNNNKNNLWVSK